MLNFNCNCRFVGITVFVNALVVVAPRSGEIHSSFFLSWNEKVVEVSVLRRFKLFFFTPQRSRRVAIRCLIILSAEKVLTPCLLFLKAN